MQNLKSVLITGSNKGVGFGILENLAQKHYKLIMACRNKELAEQSRTDLIARFPQSQIEVIELDICSSDSIAKFIPEFTHRFGTIDILINNAGMAFKGDDFNEQVVQTTLKTNFYGTVELTEALLPYINANGKVITIGSMCGKLKYLTSEDLANKFRNASKRQDIFDLAQKFVDDVRNNVYLKEGWPQWGYAISKLCINTYMRILASNDIVKEKQLQVYSCCPGWVRTDMAGQEAELSIQEGALTPVYLVELPFEVNQVYQGAFFSKQAVEQI